MKKFFALFTMILVMVVCFFSSCGESFLDEEAETPTPGDTIIVNGDTIVINDTIVIRTPVWVDVIESGDTIMRDGNGDTIWLRPDSLSITIYCQDTVTVSSDTPWALLGSEVNPQTPVLEMISGTTIWGYNHGDLPVKVIIYGIFRGRKLPLWKSERLRFEQAEYEPTMTDSTSVLNVEYVLSIGNILLAHRPQVLCTSTGIVPAYFQTMVWRSWHIGPATASYANGEATVQCPDSLVAQELWNNGEFKNPLRVLTHSKNTFSVAVSGTEVNSISAVVGKDLTVIGNKASVAEFTVTVDRTSKEIVEKSVPYTYNGKSINFVDSLHACGYKLKGGKVLSETNVRIIFIRENGNDEVDVDIPVTITEKRRIVAIDSTFIHLNYINPADYNNGIITVDANHNAEFTLHYNDGGIEIENVSYKQYISWRVSYDTEMTVEDLSSVLGRRAVVDGKVTVEGYSFVFNFLNVVCDNILFNGKNYKSYAPACSAEIVAITIETNKLVVEIVGDHDGDNSTILVELPLNVTEIILIPGRIIRGNRTDAYENQTSGRVTWDFIHTTVAGVHTVHSKQVENKTFNNHEVVTSFGAMTASDPFAYWYDASGNKHLGTLSATKMDVHNKEAYLILYQNFYKETMYTLGTAEDALNNPYRNPVRAELQKVVKGGKTLWTFDNVTFYRGSED